MRPSSLVSLLVLSLVLSGAQGIRLEKGLVSAGHQKIHEKTTAVTKTINTDTAEGFIPCKEEHCSGKNRKLEAKTPSTTINTSKNAKNGDTKVDHRLSKGKSSNEHGGKEESFSVKSSPVSEHREATPGHYPDIIDIAGMDYTPARKKPPIHN
ncbi:uncharacterized protein LOC131157888 [Malania oleifera]|uniref:uncharacterized protein LOC131157888 n=1 Tax=Malania oleifera TaxID=397392 RepID=UPI0025ADEDE5|nr:uncharacterized protein LOC131157888 [Malania oleifera]